MELFKRCTEGIPPFDSEEYAVWRSIAIAYLITYMVLVVALIALIVTIK